ncbi:MAG: sugar ABC transporter permease [Ruminococcus sp.]|nr:sugar ABC transporter permease [Ruminococcus sp.]
MKRKSVSYAKWGYIFMLPFFVVYIIFSLYPLIQTFYNSFFDYVIDRGKLGGFGQTAQKANETIKFCGLDNYINIFSKEETLVQSFLNTVIMWIVGFIPQIAVSLLLATWFTDLRLKIKAQGFFKTVIYLPNVIMASAVAFMFTSLLQKGGSLFNATSWMAGGDLSILDTVWGTRGVIGFINFLLWYGNTTILLMAAIMGIDPTLYESAQIDGATPSQIFWRITMPLIRPILSFVLVTSMIGGLQMYDVPALLTKDQGNPVGKALTIIMEVQLRKDSGVGKASAVCISIFIVSAILGIILMFGMNDDKPKKKKKKRRTA